VRLWLAGCLALALAPGVGTGRGEESEFLYRASLVQAAPGKLLELIDLYKTSWAEAAAAGDGAPFWMRHSQGDRWDLLLLFPMGSHSGYYAPERVTRRREKTSAALFAKIRLVSWHGPLVSELGNPSLYDETFLWSALSGDGSGLSWRLQGTEIHRAGTTEGILVGGCLSVLVGLVGTPYEPPMDGSILFWEEVHEEPYRIDRLLGHLRLAGRLSRLCGMVVGRPVDCAAKDPKNDVPLREIVGTHLAGTDYPVVLDFPAGHGPGKTTLPLGRVVRLDTASMRMDVSGP